MDVLIPAWIDGKLTPVEKLDAHKRGLQHRAVSVFLFLNGKTLIQQRAMSKYHTPGLWANACCTHPHWGEDAAQTAPRRLQEELGIDAPSLRHTTTLEYRADVGGGLIEHEVVDVFVGEIGDTTSLNPNPAEVMGIRWIALDDLRAELADSPEHFTPWLRIYMDQHSAEILG